MHIKFKPYILIVLFLLFSTLPFSALANIEMKCGSIANEIYWVRYCLHTVPKSINSDLLYYFHGNGNSEYGWSEAPFYNEIYNQWGINAPRVLSISYGSSWLLAEKNTSVLSGMYEHFVHFAIPMLESKLSLNPEHRLLFGISMGGFNAAQIYLKSPELFLKVALGCPAISILSPFSNDTDINAYAKRTKADYYYISNALKFVASYFPDLESWKKADPIALATKRVSSESPALNISCGDLDEYGFFEGAKIMGDIVSARGGSVEWHLLPGYHCTIDGKNIADFFTSRAYSLPSPN